MAEIGTPSVTAKSIDQKTIKVYGTIAFSGAANYVAGGVPCDLSGAALGVAVPGNPLAVSFGSQQGALYSYDAVNKKVKNYSAVNTEHSASSSADFASDVPTFCATFLR